MEGDPGLTLDKVARVCHLSQAKAVPFSTLVTLGTFSGLGLAPSWLSSQLPFLLLFQFASPPINDEDFPSAIFKEGTATSTRRKRKRF
ncbi:unnamed protein product [Ilex paraguariensis]|uniref:Uncharacterized protein n=1 Tax=Ilex paraguariensis TaxID=185542 RepID=A0ABC8S3X9_9AQUA